jgi:hypothetical protein
MTIPIPVRGRIPAWLWVKQWKAKRWLRGWRRNPNCNERRRYRNDTQFVAGEHRHVEPLVQGGFTFERVSVPFRPFRFDGPVHSDGLTLQINSTSETLSNWNWLPEGTKPDAER